MKKLIVAKRFRKVDSIAIDIEKVPNYVNLFCYLSEESLDTDVEVLVIQGIELFGEYEPVTYIEDSKEFTYRTLEMMMESMNV